MAFRTETGKPYISTKETTETSSPVLHQRGLQVWVVRPEGSNTSTHVTLSAHPVAAGLLRAGRARQGGLGALLGRRVLRRRPPLHVSSLQRPAAAALEQQTPAWKLELLSQPQAGLNRNSRAAEKHGTSLQNGELT